MAHFSEDTAIFSPSVARSAASTAKDWTYVDNWLKTKFNSRPLPPFERNNATLQALLALANLNETADENRELLARVEADALEEIKAFQNEQHDPEQDEGPTDLTGFKSELFTALEDSLTKDGKASLDAMATAAVDLGMAFPEPAQIGQAMLHLQTRVFELEQAAARVGILQRYIDQEAARLKQLLDDISGDEYRAPADLARQNLDLQRKVKAMSQAIPEMKSKVSALARAGGGAPKPTVQDVKREEDKYLELLEVKKALDQQIRVFEGLPPDTDQARQQLDAMRAELQRLSMSRDAVFENLVERETPRKGR